MTQINKRIALTPRRAATCVGPIDEALDPELFKALSDGTRLKLFSCLAKCGRSCSVSELAECCAVDFSVVSRHLTLLERAGAVTSTKEGRTVFYAVEYAKLAGDFRKLSTAIQNCAPRGSSKGGCCG